MKYSIYLQKIIDLDLLPKRGFALDIGSGNGRDTRALEDLGFEVTSIDINPSFSGVTKMPIENFLFEKEKYDVIIASNILPFIPSKSKIKEIIRNMNEALKTGGVMYLNLFGNRDEWANRITMTFFDEEEIKIILPENISVIEKSIIEGLGKTYLGKTKYCHVFGFICKK